MSVTRSTAKRLFQPVFHQVRSYSAPAERSIPPAKQKYVPKQGTYPKGFLAGSAHAGIKPTNTMYDDIALVVSENPCPAAAVFTRNVFKAAPVHVSKGFLDKRHNNELRGVIVNSGCANAITGKLGTKHAVTMAQETDRCFGGTKSGSSPAVIQEPPQTLVMSTGVIGQRLPIDRVTAAIPKVHQDLGSSHDHWLKAAHAICTTDTFPKLFSRTFRLPSHPETEYRIAGMTKGAGMIHPNMGTLLGIVCTDAKIAPEAMTYLLRTAIRRSFNCISVDGDTSTNDTVALFANGAAAPDHAQAITVPRVPEEGTPPTPSVGLGRLSDDARAFRTMLDGFTEDLAKLVVRDGEGATKFVTINVYSEISIITAQRVARSIACSSLVKTALYGKDANWGRILCAIGYAPGIMWSPQISTAQFARNGVEGNIQRQVDLAMTSVSFMPADGSEELKLVVRGEPENVDEERARRILEMEDLEIVVRLNDRGKEGTERMTHRAVMWTCDLSHEYVTINGDYRT